MANLTSFQKVLFRSIVYHNLSSACVNGYRIKIDEGTPIGTEFVFVPTQTCVVTKLDYTFNPDDSFLKNMMFYQELNEDPEFLDICKKYHNLYVEMRKASSKRDFYLPLDRLCIDDVRDIVREGDFSVLEHILNDLVRTKSQEDVKEHRDGFISIFTELSKYLARNKETHENIRKKELKFLEEYRQYDYDTMLLPHVKKIVVCNTAGTPYDCEDFPQNDDPIECEMHVDGLRVRDLLDAVFRVKGSKLDTHYEKFDDFSIIRLSGDTLTIYPEFCERYN